MIAGCVLTMCLSQDIGCKKKGTADRALKMKDKGIGSDVGFHFGMER